MAFRASVLVGVAGETTALVDHGQLGMASVNEGRQWDVSTRQFVVASATEIGGVTGSAAFAIHCGVLTVNVVAPSASVRDREHSLMAGGTLRGRRRLRRHISMANEALRAERRGLHCVVFPETLGMKVGLNVARMAGGSGTGRIIDMASVTIRHPEVRRQCLGGLVTANAVNHFWQGLTFQAVTGHNAAMAGSAV